MGKKRRQSKKEREAKRLRALERENVVDPVGDKKVADPVEPIKSEEDVRVDEGLYDVSSIAGSKVTEVVDREEKVADAGEEFDVRVSPEDVISPEVVISPEDVIEKDNSELSVDPSLTHTPPTTKPPFDDSKIHSDRINPSTLLGETFGAVWPDEPDRHRKVSTWAFVSGAILTIATVGVLLSSVVGHDESEKGRTIVSRPGEHKVVDSDFVFKGRSVKVEVVGGMVTQTSGKDLVKKVESVIDRDASEWKTDTFKKTDSMSREMKVSLMDGKATEGMFEVYVDYDTATVILLSEKGYVRLPDGTGKRIFKDLSNAGKYKD